MLFKLHIITCLKNKNRASKTVLKLDAEGRFLYIFVAYGACVRGFMNIRKVLAVDFTFLTGKYVGVPLTVVGQDTEHYIHQVAFCVVDKKCDDSWSFLFEQLKPVVEDD